MASSEAKESLETISATEALGVIRNRPQLQTPLNRDRSKQFQDSGTTPSMSQVTSVSELQDVSPTDWAYEALRSLVERYGCIVVKCLFKYHRTVITRKCGCFTGGYRETQAISPGI